MAILKIWLHVVWATKNRYPFLQKELKDELIAHIRMNAHKKQIEIDRIDGYADHLHALIRLDSERSIAEIMQLVKGESAFWINKNNKTPLKFQWAESYYAASVSERHLDRVQRYIDRQEAHHQAKNFAKKYVDYLSEYLLSIENESPAVCRSYNDEHA